MDALAAVEDSRLVTLYRYWQGKRHGRAMPSRADIDPLEIPGSLWPHVSLLDVVYEPAGPRFRYRRMGAEYCNATGSDPTGAFLDETLPETTGFRAYVVGIFHELVARRLPMYTSNLFTLRGDKAPLVVKRLALPLSNDGAVVNMVVTGHVFCYGDSAAHQPPWIFDNMREYARVALDDDAASHAGSRQRRAEPITAHPEPPERRRPPSTVNAAARRSRRRGV